MKGIFYIILCFGLFHTNHFTFGQTNSETQVAFKIRNMGISVNGKLTDVIIEKSFNKDDLDNSFINATIKVISLDTGNKKRDKHLMKADFFDTENFPQIIFNSTKIEKSETNYYIITGRLTIKNTTKVVSIPAMIHSTSLNSNFELNRRDYGVGGRSWLLSNKVKIEISITF